MDKLPDERIAEIEAMVWTDNGGNDDEALALYRTAIPELLAERVERFTAPIVCICGSTKFKQAWITENAILTGQGNIVLAVGLWGHHERVYPDTETKAKLDDLHMRKIDLCDWVWVLDVGGYIGESTRNEIEYAKKLGRPIRYLSKEFPNYREPVDLLESNNTQLHADNDVLREEIERLRDETEIEELPDWLLDENHRCRVINCIPECPAYDYGCRLRAEGMATAEKALEAVRGDASDETLKFIADADHRYVLYDLEKQPLIDNERVGKCLIFSKRAARAILDAGKGELK